MIYIIKGHIFLNNRQRNQIRKWYSNTVANKTREGDPMDIVFYMFNALITLTASEQWRTKREREITYYFLALKSHNTILISFLSFSLGPNLLAFLLKWKNIEFNCIRCYWKSFRTVSVLFYIFVPSNIKAG